MAKKEAKSEVDRTAVMATALANIERWIDGEAPHQMHGVYNFSAGVCPLPDDVVDLFEGGAYRLENGFYQFEIRDGDLIKAVRIDMKHFMSADEVVVPNETSSRREAQPQPSQEADRGEGGEGAS